MNATPLTSLEKASTRLNDYRTFVRSSWKTLLQGPARNRFHKVLFRVSSWQEISLQVPLLAASILVVSIHVK